jgi:hypothetical protein
MESVGNERKKVRPRANVEQTNGKNEWEKGLSPSKITIGVENYAVFPVQSSRSLAMEGV